MTDEVRKQLDELVKAFALNKAEASDLKEVCDNQNAVIKDIMSAEGLSTYIVDGYVATYVVKQNTKVDEERLLGVLTALVCDEEKFKELGVIKTKKYVDADELESAIYNGLVEQDMLIKIKECSKVTPVPTLTVKRKGKK